MVLSRNHISNIKFQAENIFINIYFYPYFVQTYNGIFTFVFIKSIYLLQFLCVVSSYLYIFISTTESQKRRKSRSVSHLSVLKMKTKQKQTSRVAFTECLGAHASSVAMLSSHGRLLSSSRRSLRISCTAVMSTVSLWSTPLNRPRRWRLST